MTVTEPETQQYTLDDLDHYQLTNGLLCFFGNVKDICSKVESLGVQMYYVVAEEKYYAQTDKGTATTPSYRMQTFKVVNNLLGRTVLPASDVQFDTIEKSVWFALPKIPYELREKMDAFFRAVHEEQKTESIVLLTYDTTKEGPDGWGILVPKQKNTAGDCDYEPDSVAEEKPEHVYIVGSAHSHPEMSAFASGTDHKDQADFDGIHITYGWKKNVRGGATEFHAELTMGGVNTIVDVNNIFESSPKYEANEEEIKGWLTKVDKKSYNTHIVGKGGAGFQSSSSKPSTSAYSSFSGIASKLKLYPTDGPPAMENVIIGIVAENEPKCPFCGIQLVGVDFEKRRCMSCHQYIAYQGESAEDVVRVRKEHRVYTHDIDPAANPIAKHVYLWTRNGNANNFDLVYAPGEDGKK